MSTATIILIIICAFVFLTLLGLGIWVWAAKKIFKAQKDITKSILDDFEKF